MWIYQINISKHIAVSRVITINGGQDLDLCTVAAETWFLHDPKVRRYNYLIRWNK